MSKIAIDDELYPGERDELGQLVYRISLDIIRSDPYASDDARALANSICHWEDATEEDKADSLHLAWEIRRKVLRDRGLL